MPKLATQMKEKTTGAKRSKYTSSFREEVLRMILNSRPVSELERI